jgi:hypothetical protein
LPDELSRKSLNLSQVGLLNLWRAEDSQQYGALPRVDRVQLFQ